MKNDPELGARFFKPEEKFNGEGVAMTLTVSGGLNFLKGNAKPYFSLTCWYHQTGRPNSRDGGGAAHELILKYFPQFADLAALHLSDIDGVPMHPEANGMYWLAGAMGNPFGEQYHGGNSNPARSPEECLQIFADHLRIPLDHAAAIRDDVKRLTMAQPNNRRSYAKEALASFTKDMRARWKIEADTCIIRHGLIIYGSGVTG